MQIKQMQTHTSTQNVQNLYIKVPIHAVADDYTTVASPVILCTLMLRLNVQMRLMSLPRFWGYVLKVDTTADQLQTPKRGSETLKCNQYVLECGL